ncbi:MAG: transglycosylase domain-containing protein [Deltaproteobacteria bacterium]|nr:MAG: transglycosylase domain-containing protein [Deltaproteobacteria bacterium]
MKINLIYAVVNYFVFITVAASSCFVIIFKHYYDKIELLDVAVYQTYRPAEDTKIYDNAGRYMMQYGQERRTLVSLDDIPNHVICAFVAAEDSRFYAHNGVDFKALFRAVLCEIRYQFTGRGRSGGSTITQQLMKSIIPKHPVNIKKGEYASKFLRDRLFKKKKTAKRNYFTKLVEMKYAQKMETMYSKEEILEKYLNEIYFGYEVYGIEEAARFYFGVNVFDLTLSQASILACIPKAPSVINPHRNKERLRIRQKYVLTRMFLDNYITKEEAKKAFMEGINVIPKVPHHEEGSYYYTYPILSYFKELIGDIQLRVRGIDIYTAADMRIQKIATHALRSGLEAIDKRQGIFRGPLKKITKHGYDEWKKTARQKPMVKEDVKGIIRKINDDKGMAIVEIGIQKYGVLFFSDMQWIKEYRIYLRGKIIKKINSKSFKKMGDLFKVGDIISVKIERVCPVTVLSINQDPLIQGALVAQNPLNHKVLALVGGYDKCSFGFNRALKAYRQAGSSFKPLIYAAAIDKGIIEQDTLIDDSPRKYGTWEPQNYNKKYLGYITVRECLTKSINMCCLQVLEDVGLDPLISFAKRIENLKKESFIQRNLTLAFGACDVNPLYHVNAYSIFPSGGVISEPILLKEARRKDDTLIVKTARRKGKRVLREESAFIILDMLKGSVGKTAIKEIGGPIAGKSGTSNNYRSTWFVGFSQDIVAGVYIGYDNNLPLKDNEYGSRTAKPIWIEFMRKAAVHYPLRDFWIPKWIEWKLINRETPLISTSENLEDYLGEFFYDMDQWILKYKKRKILNDEDDEDDDNEPGYRYRKITIKTDFEIAVGAFLQKN